MVEKIRMKEKMFKSCLFISNRNCSYDCPFCSSKSLKTKDANFIDIINALEIMSNLSEFIVIMGGEPLEYEHIYDVIGYLSDTLGMDFTIVTNGSKLSESIAMRLSESGLKNITISVDSYKGFKDKFDIYRKYFDDVSINLLYEEKTIGKLFDTIRYFTSLKVWTIVAVYNYSTDDRKHCLMGNYDSTISINDSRLKYRIIDDVKNVLYNYDKLLIHNTKEYIRNIPKFMDMSWHCSYPYRLVVNNDLMIMPCEDMVPFDFNIFDLNRSIEKYGFEWYVKIFKERIEECNGCYLSCYYDLEKLTRLEVMHKGGKNVNFYDTGLKQCVRARNREIKESEDHICWFCGSPITIASSIKTFCKKCGLMKCTTCGLCFCDATENEKKYLLWINEKYCCNEEKLKNFNKIEFELSSREFNVNGVIIRNAIRCIQRCSDYFRNII